MVLLLIMALIVPAFAAQIRQIGWGDLRAKVEFKDPFETLTQDQLVNLSTYARIMRLNSKSPAKVSEGMLAQARELENSLKKQGVDIEGLLARRAEIIALRTQQANATVKTLDGVHIRIPGYALPLEFDGRKVREFLLVPWVGACIHTPPPPPNQIVHVRLNSGIENEGRFKPVWVTGKVKVGALSKELYLVDGSGQINIGYSIDGAFVEAYKTN